MRRSSSTDRLFRKKSCGRDSTNGETFTRDALGRPAERAGSGFGDAELQVQYLRPERVWNAICGSGGFGLDRLGVSDHRKTSFFERAPDRATSSAPKAQSSVRLSARVATAHNLTSTHGRAPLKSAAGARRHPTSGLPTIHPEPPAL